MGFGEGELIHLLLLLLAAFPFLFCARLIASPFGSFSVSVLQFGANSKEVSMDAGNGGRGRTCVLDDVEATVEIFSTCSVVWMSF